MSDSHCESTGLGENIRGTFLGGVDTIVHSDSTKNDAIARKGREEQAQGVANLEQRPIAAEYTGERFAVFFFFFHLYLTRRRRACAT
jgi:hypothetical protein